MNSRIKSTVSKTHAAESPYGAIWESKRTISYRLCNGITGRLIRLLAIWTVLTGFPLFVPAAAADQAESGDSQLRQKALTMYEGYRKSFPQVADIDAKDAVALVGNDNVVFVDVRRHKEQAVSMIPGAITADQLTDDPDSYRDKRIIAYCTISYRSGKLAAKLEKKGLTVVNLRGGLLGWTHAGGPLVDDRGPTNRLHVYGRKWDLAPAGIETVH